MTLQDVAKAQGPSAEALFSLLVGERATEDTFRRERGWIYELREGEAVLNINRLSRELDVPRQEIRRRIQEWERLGLIESERVSPFHPRKIRFIEADTIQ